MKFLLIMMALFQLWDGVITQVFADNGIIKEGNPLMAGLVNNGDFFLFKLIGVAIAVVALWATYKYLPRLSMTIASCITVFYMGVIAWNFTVFFNIV